MMISGIRSVEAKRLKQQIQEFEAAYKTNTLDAHAWTNWGVALVKMSHVVTDKARGKNELLEAQEKFKMALEINPNDFEAKWNLGITYMKIPEVDAYMSNDFRKEHAIKALECFYQVRATDPEFRKSSNTIRVAQADLDYVISLSEPRKLSPKDEELFTTVCEAQKACEDNPGDPNNWKKWCMSLVFMRGLLEDGELPLPMLLGAKKEMKKAVCEKPNDLNAMWSLGEVYMYILSTDSSIFREDKGRYRNYCAKALELFERVRARDPKFCIGATGLAKARQELTFVSSFS